MIYVARQKRRPYVKIGFTTREVHQRIREFNTGSVEGVELIFAMQGDLADERRLHRKFSRYRVRRSAEWFRLEGELAVWIEREKERTDRERLAEAQAFTAQRLAERAAREERERLARASAERQSATNRYNTLCSAIAFGRYALREENFFLRCLVQRHLPALEEEARKLAAAHGFGTSDIPPPVGRLEACFQAWQRLDLPTSWPNQLRRWGSEVLNASWFQALAFWLVLLVGFPVLVRCSGDR